MARLYHWYFSEQPPGRYILHGIVTGHNKVSDATFIRTSPVLTAKPTHSRQSGVYAMQTKNTLYTCSMEDCNYSECRTFIQNYAAGPDTPDWMADWKSRFEEFAVQVQAPTWDIPDDTILLKLGNSCKYFFGGMCVNADGQKLILSDAVPHIGMFQDSILCWLRDEERSKLYDFRYFPRHSGILEFYGWTCHGLPVCLENCGDCTLTLAFKYLPDPSETICLAPGERTKIEPNDPRIFAPRKVSIFDTVANAETEVPEEE